MINTEAVDVALAIAWRATAEVRPGRVDAGADVTKRLSDGSAFVHVLAAFTVIC